MLALVDSSFELLPKGSSCWGDQLNAVLLNKQFPASCYGISGCAGSLIEQKEAFHFLAALDMARDLSAYKGNTDVLCIGRL